MAAKIVKRHLKPVLSKAVRDYLKDSTSGDSFYAAVAFPYREDFIAYAGDSDSDSVGVKSRKDSDIEEIDEQFYSQHIISLHKLYTGGVSRVSQRQDWSSGHTYKPWPDASSHVVVKTYSGGSIQLNVYRCLFSPLSESIVAPSETFSSAITTADGYVWKYLYSISDAEALLFMTENWIPVPERVTEEEAKTLAPGSGRYSQYSSQQNAVYGELYAVSIDSDVAWADSDLGLKREASGQNVIAKDMSGGTPTQEAVFTIYYDLATRSIKPLLVQIGKGYIGPVEFVLQSDRTKTIPGLAGHFPPGTGHGSRIAEEMFVSHVMAVVRNVPENLIADLTNENTFNVVSLVRNPIDVSTRAIAAKSSYVACKAMDIANNTFSPNDLIYTSTGEPFARVVTVNGSKVYYVNHLEEGELNIIAAGNFVKADPAATTLPVSYVYEREVVFNTHNHILIDFKVAEIIRSQEQTESFSFIISF